jgi:hypothetical protein
MTNPIVIRPYSVLTNGRQQRQIQPYYDHMLCLLTDNDKPMVIPVLWLGLSFLSSDSKENMWSYYGWGYRCCRLSVSKIHDRIDHILCLLMDDNNNKPNHNTITYYVYWLTTTTNSTIIRPYIMSTDRRHTICGPIMVGFVVVSQ